jgi:mycothiol synthase
VYVLGVDPDAAGTGLGTALTLAGLHYMRDLGLTQAMLYVDESNPRAVALYRRLGFALWSTDVAYRRHEPVYPQAVSG